MPGVDYIVMCIIALSGVIMIITNKPLFIGTQRYTEESIKRYPRPAGVMNILFGLAGFAFFYTLRLLGKDKISGWIVLVSLAVWVITVIATIVVNKKTLVKK